MEQEQKTCKMCEVLKPIDCFERSKSYPCLPKKVCKDCESKGRKLYFGKASRRKEIQLAREQDARKKNIGYVVPPKKIEK